MNQFEKARNFLRTAQISEALDVLENFISTNQINLFSNELVNLRARYTRNKLNAIKDTETTDSVNREWNKLTFALSELLNEIEREIIIEVKREELQNSYQKITESSGVSNPKTSDDWNELRNSIYNNSKGILLVHQLWPSHHDNQEFDIYIFLIGHKSRSLNDIDYAEFFLGRYWDSKVFRVKNKDNKIGIIVSAYGPFLCLCKVTFLSGETFFTNRYIDFEQGDLIKKSRK